MSCDIPSRFVRKKGQALQVFHVEGRKVEKVALPAAVLVVARRFLTRERKGRPSTPVAVVGFFARRFSRARANERKSLLWVARRRTSSSCTKPPGNSYVCKVMLPTRYCYPYTWYRFRRFSDLCCGCLSPAGFHFTLVSPSHLCRGSFEADRPLV